ncbi:MAG: hypothetical protein JGK30_07920 [Microcoleus sp. PH2017_40_RAT_O_B]|uniref:hypothetical protein n=1 Tax=unclassified Microcoleus TaxID=2642155 RepID=UPI001D7EA209|nr:MULTISPECIES: hypothetical protein [unclassified Microcoleus]MCC3508290.1 hypothetical protein [Microcoleus sp. PH2017_17_BER_D_A]TAE66796.1 MAG: hypothetical protein EAZ86_19355 [Oscillatoriales cyanobacterium]MCC3572156.1 hypothetical protein [Microcoleus sp. PH2017_34_RAT_O_A]MCC3609429.1 hypothetical protein [Microcoleus sp. PH2017_40_RAT_O_B]TAG60315.1 MAG: hypothetical protein EAZ28_08005 [Oscillatoriales cyanobacterium]
MTNIVLPTTPGTVTAPTLEGMIFQLAWNFGIGAEKDSIKNPNQVDYVSATIEPEFVYESYPVANAGRMVIVVSGLPIATVALPYSGRSTVGLSDYLTGSGFLPGSGGTPTFALAAANWCQHLWDAILLLHRLQIQPAKNPLGLNLVASWNMEGAGTNSVLNAVGSANLELPLMFVNNGGFPTISATSPMGNLI